jgi:hypothetical protein
MAANSARGTATSANWKNDPEKQPIYQLRPIGS